MSEEGPWFGKEPWSAVLALIVVTIVAAICVGYEFHHIIEPYIDVLENASIA